MPSEFCDSKHRGKGKEGKKKKNPSDGNLRLRWKPSMIPKKRIFFKRK